MQSMVIRYVVATIGLLICGWAIWTSWNAGASRLLAGQSRKETPSLALADRAISLSPFDPEAYYARGRAYLTLKRYPEASKDFAAAVNLRPGHYLSWLQLGYARSRAGDQQGALTAYQEGVRLAPSYGQPRWFLGNALLRAGRRDEGFSELRRAAINDPGTFVQTIAVAWNEYDGDASAVERALQPQSSSARLQLARFLVEHENATAALELFRGTDNVSAADRKALLEALIKARKLNEAYEVWSSGRGASHQGSRSGIASITDSGFESDINLDESGFGWRPARDLKTVRVFLDTNLPRSGGSSLRLSWTGDSSPSTPVVSQIVLVEPNTRYRVSFSARTEELLTIGLPIVTVSDSSSVKETVLGESSAFPRGTSGWQDYSIDFTTGEITSAVLIAIRRQPCDTAPCAALGNVWVDEFSLRRVQ